jgi:hypothetical protein
MRGEAEGEGGQRQVLRRKRRRRAAGERRRVSQLGRASRGYVLQRTGESSFLIGGKTEQRSR